MSLESKIVSYYHKTTSSAVTSLHSSPLKILTKIANTTALRNWLTAIQLFVSTNTLVISSSTGTRRSRRYSNSNSICNTTRIREHTLSVVPFLSILLVILLWERCGKRKMLRSVPRLLWVLCRWCSTISLSWNGRKPVMKHFPGFHLVLVMIF